MATEKKTGAFLQITMNVKESDRAAATAVYNKYRKPFLEGIQEAINKQILVLIKTYRRSMGLQPQPMPRTT